MTKENRQLGQVPRKKPHRNCGQSFLGKIIAVAIYAIVKKPEEKTIQLAIALNLNP